MSAEQQLAELAAQVEMLTARCDAFMRTIEAMCREAGVEYLIGERQAVAAAAQAAPARRRVPSGRDRHGMHVVRPS